MVVITRIIAGSGQMNGMIGEVSFMIPVPVRAGCMHHLWPVRTMPPMRPFNGSSATGWTVGWVSSGVNRFPVQVPAGHAVQAFRGRVRLPARQSVSTGILPKLIAPQNWPLRTGLIAMNAHGGGRRCAATSTRLHRRARWTS